MTLPRSDRRRILLAATGLSPQVVTETVFALALRRDPPWVPAEIHLVTTTRGADNARLMLLAEEPGWFHRLRRDWRLPAIEFGPEHIHVARRSDGTPLDDIRDDADNLAVADAIAERVRTLTANPQTELHASIAGGRKTMGFYLGYAMSLYGRPQDRLSHVLVAPPFESHPEFYYPSPVTRVIHSLDRGQHALDASRAEVWLGDIPFVRLRHGLPQALLEGRAGFAAAVAAAQARLGPPSLSIDYAGRRVVAGGVEVRMPSAELAFLGWFARRAARDEPGLPAPKVPEPGHRDAYLHEYHRIVATIDDTHATASRLDRERGMDKSFFEERKSKVKRLLVAALGSPRASPYLVIGHGRPMQYRLPLDAPAIRFLTNDATPER